MKDIWITGHEGVSTEKSKKKINMKDIRITGHEGVNTEKSKKKSEMKVESM